MDFSSDEFAEALVGVGLHARRSALAAGCPVVFRDNSGRYVQETPDGKAV